MTIRPRVLRRGRGRRRGFEARALLARITQDARAVCDGRMGIDGVELFLYCETDIDVIIDQVLDMRPRPALVMIDSIQTMRTEASASTPGSVTQVGARVCRHFFFVWLLGAGTRSCSPSEMALMCVAHII